MEKKIERVPYISKWYKYEEETILQKMRTIKELTFGAILNLQYCKNFKSITKLNNVSESKIDLALEKLQEVFEKTDFKVETESPIKSNNELLHFDFKDAGSDYDVDKYFINTTWTTEYSKLTVQLKYVCNLTKEDLNCLVNKLYNVKKDVTYIVCNDIKSFHEKINNDLNYIIDYLENNGSLIDKAHEKQLEELIEQSKPKKSYDGTLGEHWEELMTLFEIKEKHDLTFLITYVRDYTVALKNNMNFCPESSCGVNTKLFFDKDSLRHLSDLKFILNKLGIDFIKDFIKACEKCEG